MEYSPSTGRFEARRACASYAPNQAQDPAALGRMDAPCVLRRSQYGCGTMSGGFTSDEIAALAAACEARTPQEILALALGCFDRIAISFSGAEDVALVD